LGFVLAWDGRVVFRVTIHASFRFRTEILIYIFFYM
jgi:hypothetical protein